MKLYSRAKINLFLNVTGVDPLDGYHYIDSLIQEITLADEIEVEDSIENDVIEFVNFSELNKNSTIHKSLELFKNSYGIKDNFRIRITKNIPIGAGLGGGSSNSATLLNFLAKRYKVRFEEVVEIARNVGSDVPFFLYGGLCRVGGKGERVTPLNSRLKGVYFIVIYPEIQISTKWAYSLFDMYDSSISIPDLENISCITIDFLNKIVYNSFQKVIFENLVDLKNIYEELLALTDAAFLFMSGSGSSLVAAYGSKALRERDFRKLIDAGVKAFCVEPFYR